MAEFNRLKNFARPISEYPGKSFAKAIQLMIQNNLSNAVAQHPHELITTVEMVRFFKIGQYL